MAFYLGFAVAAALLLGIHFVADPGPVLATLIGFVFGLVVVPISNWISGRIDR